MPKRGRRQDHLKIAQGDVEDLLDPDSFIIEFSLDQPFAYIAFLDGNTGKGNSGDESAFAVKPVEFTVPDTGADMEVTLAVMSGEAVDDVALNEIVGTDEDDQLFATSSNELLTGGAGDDSFVWLSNTGGDSGDPTWDVVTDFGQGNNVLDLSDLLPGEARDDLGQYLFAEVQDGDTVVYISSQGVGNPKENADQVIVLQNFVLEGSGDVIGDLLDNQQMKIDQ